MRVLAAAEPTSLHDVDPSIVIEMRHLTNHDFMAGGSRATGHSAR
jgi:hypothetical protein